MSKTVFGCIATQCLFGSHTLCTVALAVDLAETVGRLQGERPVVVAATQNPQLSNFCSSRQVIQVAEHSSSLSWSCKQEDEAIESSWSVSTKDGSGNKAYYAILKSVDKGSRIVWKREE